MALLDDVTVTLCIATGEDDASEETVSVTLVSPSDIGGSPLVSDLAPCTRTLFASTGQTRLLLANMTLCCVERGCRPRSVFKLITSRWKMRDMMHNCSIRVDAGWCTGAGSTKATHTKTAGIELVYAGPHCHAPSMNLLSLRYLRTYVYIEIETRESPKVLVKIKRAKKKVVASECCLDYLRDPT